WCGRALLHVSVVLPPRGQARQAGPLPGRPLSRLQGAHGLPRRGLQVSDTLAAVWSRRHMTLLHLGLAGLLLARPAAAQTCAALPRCRVEAPDARQPSFAILQGDCGDYRDVTVRFL